MSKQVWKKYQRKGLSEMRPYVKGEDLSKISVAKTDNPEKDMGMVARNPKNHEDQWYVAKKYFKENLELVVKTEKTGKTFGNTDASGAKKNVKDIVFWGNGDTFKLISKASSKAEGWMKSTKAIDVKGKGVVVQVTTQQGDNVAEALTFVPGAYIEELKDEKGNVVERIIK